MPFDYYVILGIERGADLPQIKRAYREAIKRYHPDTDGNETDADKFIEVHKAYEVLSDMKKRRAYDAKLRQGERPKQNSIYGKRRGPQATARDNPQYISSPIADLFQGFFSRYSPMRIHERGVSDNLHLEIILTQEEAFQGGTFPITVPVFAFCTECDQRRWNYTRCPSCMGYGIVKIQRQFNLNIPPGTQDGTISEIPLRSSDLFTKSLIMHVRIEWPPSASHAD